MDGIWIWAGFRQGQRQWMVSRRDQEICRKSWTGLGSGQDLGRANDSGWFLGGTKKFGWERKKLNGSAGSWVTEVVGSNRGGRCASSATQRQLHSVQPHCPTTAGSAQFCLLCCQPEPIPGSLAARMFLLTLRDPCRLPAWLGRSINTDCRACGVPLHASTQSSATGNEFPDIEMGLSSS